jgi:hypothetical protein
MKILQEMHGDKMNKLTYFQVKILHGFLEMSHRLQLVLNFLEICELGFAHFSPVEES